MAIDRNLPSRVVPLMAALLLGLSWPVAGHSTSSQFTYTYDALGRVTSVTYVAGTFTYTTTYSYDAAGNRTTVSTTRSGG